MTRLRAFGTKSFTLRNGEHFAVLKKLPEPEVCSNGFEISVKKVRFCELLMPKIVVAFRGS